MRGALEGVIGWVLRIFFRKLEWVGGEKIPGLGPVIFCLNHPNGLIDPLLLLCHSPRPVCFLAKEPLFRTPIIGWGARALDSIPVYRAQDGPAAMERNRLTFESARRALSDGRALAIFPEGVSHSEPGLKPLKSGAARIALGARLPGLRIVPGSLIYSSKMTFRSRALVFFGEPFEVALAATDEVTRAEIRQLTNRIRESLETTVAQARSRLEGTAGEAGARPTPCRLLKLGLLAAPGLVGIACHYPVYRLTGWLATRLSSNEEDLVATFKVLGSMLLFPLTWLAIAGTMSAWAGTLAGATCLAALPPLGLAALRFTELLAEETEKWQEAGSE